MGLLLDGKRTFRRYFPDTETEGMEAAVDGLLFIT